MGTSPDESSTLGKFPLEWTISRVEENFKVSKLYSHERAQVTIDTNKVKIRQFKSAKISELEYLSILTHCAILGHSYSGGQIITDPRLTSFSKLAVNFLIC